MELPVAYIDLLVFVMLIIILLSLRLRHERERERREGLPRDRIDSSCCSRETRNGKSGGLRVSQIRVGAMMMPLMHLLLSSSATIASL